MVIFEDIDDVIEWLKPMDYGEVWDAARPYRVFSEADRDHYDGLIAGGTVEEELIVSCLKTMVRLELTQMFDLDHRIHDPVDRQYLLSTH